MINKILVIAALLFFLPSAAWGADVKYAFGCACGENASYYNKNGSGTEADVAKVIEDLRSKAKACIDSGNEIECLLDLGADNISIAKTNDFASVAAQLETFKVKEVSDVAKSPTTSSIMPIVPEECRNEALISGTGSNVCNLDAVEKAIINVSRLVLYVSGGLALLMFVYGGLMYILAGGSQNLVSKAKTILTYATMGLVIVLAAGLILRTIIGVLTDSIK